MKVHNGETVKVMKIQTHALTLVCEIHVLFQLIKSHHLILHYDFSKLLLL